MFKFFKVLIFFLLVILLLGNSYEFENGYLENYDEYDNQDVLYEREVFDDQYDNDLEIYICGPGTNSYDCLLL